MTSLMPQFLQSLQQSLQSSLPELGAGPVQFCHAWSVLMFALACTDPASQQQAARYGHACDTIMHVWQHAECKLACMTLSCDVCESIALSMAALP